MKSFRWSFFLTAILFSFGIAQTHDTTNTLFGPKRFTRSTGSPKTETVTFSKLPNVAPPYIMYIVNGESNGSNRISSGTVKLNGVEILKQSDFNQNAAAWTKPVNLLASNTLVVNLASKPGSFITIRVNGTTGQAADTTDPIVDLRLPIDNFVTNQQTVVVSGTVSDSTAVTVTVNGNVVAVGSDGAFSYQLSVAEGLNTITVVATDAAGNHSTVTRTVRLDTQSPIVNLTSPIDSFITKQQTVNVSGTVMDSTTVTLTINGSSVTVGVGGAFSYQLSVVEGMNTITIVATDAVGNKTTVTRKVRRDTQSPIVNLTAPIDSLITKQQIVNVSGTVTDSTVVTLTINGTSVPVGVGGVFSYQLSVVSYRRLECNFGGGDRCSREYNNSYEIGNSRFAITSYQSYIAD